MIFTIDDDLELGSWLDYGMFLQNVMVAARARGLDTCPQAAFITYHHEIRRLLGIPADQRIVSGMALGYPATPMRRKPGSRPSANRFPPSPPSWTDCRARERRLAGGRPMAMAGVVKATPVVFVMPDPPSSCPALGRASTGTVALFFGHARL